MEIQDKARAFFFALAMGFLFALGALGARVVYLDHLERIEREYQQERARKEHLCWYYGTANGGVFCKD